jgi:hypothetical protein
MSGLEFFEYWSKLAAENPALFEYERQRLIRKTIESAPEHIQQRLWGLQWHIDMVRGQAKNPLQACIELSGLLWDFVCAEHGFIKMLQNLVHGDESCFGYFLSPPSAKVLLLSQK